MEKSVEVETTRYRNIPGPLRVIFIILCTAGLGVAVFYLFGFTFWGAALLDFGYYWLLITLYSSCVFLVLPGHKKDRHRLPWYDLLAAVLTFGLGCYFFSHAWDMAFRGWTYPSTLNFGLGIIMWLLVLEGGRRMGGPIYFAVCLILGLYPLMAPYMPGILWGQGLSLVGTIGSLNFTESGLVGIPAKVIGEILIGFLLFAGILIASGAGTFFLNVALCLFGRFRGGPAKVAVVSSGFFGSLSGSIFSNIVATGSVTIPTMKRIGYPPHYAGAIEACASTGGVLMPPVMGAVAFVMCELLGMEYAVVILAAAIPAVLYYFGLLMQVDAYAARVGLKGVPREEVPSLKKTLREGWHFVAVFLFLLWGLLYMRWEALAPWYATGLMLVLSFVRRETMMTPRRIIEALIRVGTLITQAVAIILPIGFVVSGVTVTGMSGSFTAGLVQLGGGNIFLVLLMGVIACYVMGMAGMTIAAYIFLAVTLAPALIALGQLNTLAVHLFIIYYAMLAAITPPVAGGAFLAATIAGASPMRTAFQAMRLGVVIYLVPFFFLFNEALVLQGSILDTLYLFALCLLGIILIAAGMEGYLLKVGKLRLWTRPFLVIAGTLIGFPEWKTTIAGAILVVVIVFIMRLTKDRKMAGEKIEASP